MEDRLPQLTIQPPHPGGATNPRGRRAARRDLTPLALFLLASVFLGFPLQARSDSSTIIPAETPFADPARGRLLWMSTGRVMPGGTVSLGVFELVVVQSGYGIADVAQINASGTIGYFSLGSKIRILPPGGIFQGIAAGVDVGFTQKTGRFILPRGGLYAVNLAASFGSEDVQLHVNGIRAYPFERRERDISYLQLGCSAVLHRSPSEITTLLAELWMVETRYPDVHFNPIVLPVGIRYSSRGYTFEIAMMVLPTVIAEGRSGFPIVPLPYIGFQWFI